MAKDQSSDLPNPMERGSYAARFAQSDADLRAAQQLRHLCFVDAAARPPLANGIDADRFDPLCEHVLIEDQRGQLLCCFRVLALSSGADLNLSYAAQFYDLERLSSYSKPMVELGRFCIHPDNQDADVLRLAWGMLASFVDLREAGMLFGCSSFAGTDPAPYAAAFNLLAARHLAPSECAPLPKAAETIPYATTAQPVTDQRVALGQVPSLLKTYLTMGGWVSDHAVIDREMNTLHVFTGLEISAIPPARAAALRSV